MAMWEEKCERELIDQLMKAMRDNSVPYPIEHSVYFLGLIKSNNVFTKYLEMYDTETRALALILFIGINGYEDDGVKAQDSLVNPWIDLSSRWLVDVGIENFNVGNMHCLLQAAFELAVSSFPIEIMEMKLQDDRMAMVSQAELNRQAVDIATLKNLRKIIKSITENAKKLVKKEIEVRDRDYVSKVEGLDFVPNIRYLVNTFFSPKDTSIKKQMYDTVYLKECEDKVNALKKIYDNDKEVTKAYMQLYFWLRLESLLNVKLVLDRHEPVTRFQANSYIDKIQIFVNNLIGQGLINYDRDFFAFIKKQVNADNDTLQEKSLEEKLANLPFILGDFFADYDSKDAVDFYSFLIKLKKESVDCYSDLLVYEKAAATIAYSITDPFMFERNEKKEKEKVQLLLKGLPYTDDERKKLRYQWDGEIKKLKYTFTDNAELPPLSIPSADIKQLHVCIDHVIEKQENYYSATTIHGMVHNLKNPGNISHLVLLRVFQKYQDFGIVPAKAQFAHALQQKIRNIRGSK